MKFLLSFFLVFIMTFQNSHSQVIDTSTDKSPQESYNYFSLKQKRQKTAAWLLLGGGVTTAITGLIVGMNNLDENIFEDKHKGEAIFIIGGAITISSIPLFISARSNARKARMSLKSETLTLGNSTYKKSRNIAIALSIDL